MRTGQLGALSSPNANSPTWWGLTLKIISATQESKGHLGSH